MSWSGFKKNVGRATTQLAMKTGHVEKTTDREYEVEERRYRTLESASLRLQKEAKGYLDSLRAMTASQMRIAETIDAFYGDSGAKDGVSRSYKQAVEDLDAETVKALDGPYRYVPAHLRKHVFNEEEGVYDDETLADIEAEMNFIGGCESRRKWTRAFKSQMEGDRDFESAAELMDIVYRTTVLEPINRFCAYFPDINECIKKRNHKMLDYDAMRSKVKRLVEKPDKDPTKLPRTEKETEMVSMKSFLDEPSEHRVEDISANLSDVDLSIPSPPKALDNIKRIQQLQAEEEEMVHRHSGLTGSPSIKSRVSSHCKSGLRSPEPDSLVYESWGAGMLQRSPTHSSFRPSSIRFPRLHDTLVEEALLQQRSASSPPTRHAGILSSSHLEPQRLSASPSITSTISEAMRKRRTKRMTQSSRPTVERARTPFFHPSELEQLMQPLKDEYIRKQTDMCVQAKAAYDQLNEQLTNELPQLIDLRVPYLDPSFEALVKIQLRFCAEAYSRMAQVQQYLDASTRDQYASGDLDQRVEDVLGQIRELSIAGTV